MYIVVLIDYYLFDFFLHFNLIKIKMIPKIIFDKIYYYIWKFRMTKINIYYKEHIHRHNIYINYTCNATCYLLENGYGKQYNWRYIETGWMDEYIYNNRKINKIVGRIPKRYVYSGID